MVAEVIASFKKKCLKARCSFLPPRICLRADAPEQKSNLAVAYVMDFTVAAIGMMTINATL
jgi:hypothetical protein